MSDQHSVVQKWLDRVVRHIKEMSTICKRQMMKIKNKQLTKKQKATSRLRWFRARHEEASVDPKKEATL
ncbi:hypothetical protein WQE_51422 [Paraburkholderia hospita]|uniref:Uncharacterized protein n=1 Tax=Paraburkholderia hospita TaxID=169430 RepID=A0ABN0F3E1_9BURK|nr:hypothetical protein WQE_51422 [Paraburkholderia hospita]OUL82650.1 hypothetical protein CA602_23830 [Paraburkholderia hospita]